uniref:Hydroxyproline-rich glycopeptide n=1 Tax=Solanum nigrum TaxID=4112 RepID=B3U1A8_SOLNI|nr:hydroxyproline-rich glycopeptide precursor [Solanum nigrum]
MILFFRAFSILIIISFLIFVGAEARTLLGNHGGMLKLKKGSIGNYGRNRPYITPSPPEASPSTKQEIVNGRHDHVLPPPSPKHEPIIGQLTTSTSTSPDQDHDHEEAAAAFIIIRVGGRHDHVPAPPAPKPEDEQGQIIITTSSTMNINQHYLPLQASY